MNKELLIGCVALVLGSMALRVDAATIAINEQKEYQTIVGMGGHDPLTYVNDCVNDMGMSATTVRIASDGSLQPNVATLKAMLNAGVKVFTLSPWSPPAYMKYNDSDQGTDATWNRLSNGIGPCCSYLDPNAPGERGAKRNYYPDYAAYLVQVLKKFKQDVGVDAYAISPQNEPVFAQPFPSCVYSPGQMRDLVWELGKAMAAEGLLAKTKISVAEDMANGFGLSVTVSIRDTATSKYISAVGVHGYSSDGISPAATSAKTWKGIAGYCETSNTAKKKFDLWQTEISGYVNWNGGTGGDGGQVPGAFELGKGMYQALKYGHISIWLWWRLAVTEDYWIDETLILDGTKLKNYYVSKQFFKFIRPGAVMIDCSESADTTVGAIAFNDKTAKTLSIVAINTKATSQTITFTGANLPATMDAYVTSESQNCVKLASPVQTGSVSIPANSIMSLTANNYNPPVVGIGDVRIPRMVTAKTGKGAYFGIDGRKVQLTTTSAKNSHFKSVLIRTDGSNSGTIYRP